MLYMSLDTQMLLDALVFVPILLHPIIFILFNPEYREGFRYMWKNLYCSKGGSERSVPSVQKQKYRGNARPIIKGGGGQGGGFQRGGYRRSDREDLVREVQPMIMPSGARQPMVPQMQQKIGQPFIPTGGQTYIPTGGAGQPYIPLQTLSPSQQSGHQPGLMDQTLDQSFDMESPPGDPTHRYGTLPLMKKKI